jgi:putative immunoreactiveantigen PG97
MKHLKLFGNASELKAYVDGSDYLEPFVGTDSQGGGVVRYNRVAENIIRLFVDGAENITILKGEYEKINYDAPKFVVLHPGWNNLDMNGELKDGFVISDGDDSQKLARIKQIDFSKFTGKRLGSFMFSKTGVEELILPDTIEEIGEGCFYGNLLLKKIILPKKIKKIPALLFNSCMSLKEVNLHEGILSIGQSSFTSVSIKTFIIPSTVKKIEDSFYMYLSNGDVIENGSVRFQSITPPEFTNHIFDEIDRIEVPMSAVETYKNLNIPGWKEKFGDKIVGY